MKVTMESTPTITVHNGTQVRVWQGVTEGGIPCLLFVAGVAVHEGADQTQFVAELIRTDMPVEVRALRDVLDPRMLHD